MGEKPGGGGEGVQIAEDGGGGGSVARTPCKVCGEPRGPVSPCPHCGMD